MLYMIVERFAGNDMRPVYARLRERGRGLPDGLVFVAAGSKPISPVASS